MPRWSLAVSTTVVLLTLSSLAQQAPSPPSPVKPSTPIPNPLQAASERARAALQQAPAPRPEDVRSIDALVAAVYDAISGPAGQARDWSRFRALFHPGAQLVPVRHVKPGSPPGLAPLTPEDYAAWGGTFFHTHGFYEKETHRRVSGYGDLVTVLSAYETRESPTGPVTARGVNSLQLAFDGQRWWVLHLAWMDEKTAGLPVPQDFSRPEPSSPRE